MANLEEMNKWNYKEAWSFFKTYAMKKKYIPETRIYIENLISSVETEDIRNRSSYDELTKELMSSQCFIIIDGPSNTGKSTFAQRLSKVINAEVLDIDYLCKDYIERKVSRCRNQFEAMITLMQMDKETDEYILKNLEEIVAQKAKTGKSVILVGMYLEIIYRCILARTLGNKYFKRTISLFCLEHSFSKIENMMKSRSKEFDSKTMPGEYKRLLSQYTFAKKIASGANGKFLTLGMDKSYIVDTCVSDWYK